MTTLFKKEEEPVIQKRQKVPGTVDSPISTGTMHRDSRVVQIRTLGVLGNEFELWGKGFPRWD